MKILYAWCPCGAEDTVYEPEGGPLKDGTLERFMRRHDGHAEAAYCDLTGTLHYGAPDGPTKHPDQ